MKTLLKTTAVTLALATLGVACTPIEQLASQTTQVAKQADHALNSLNTKISLDTAKNVEKLNYITGIQSPEDLVQIPDTKWLIAS